MTRIEHYEDPNAPRPNRLVPAASAVVTDQEAAVLLVRRTDNGLWTIPGGAMEPGEDIATCCRREVLEESGYDVEISRLVGIYSNPRHVVEYADGEVRQQFSVCFACQVIGGRARTSDESSQVEFVPAHRLDALAIHPSTLLRISHALDVLREPYIG